MVRYSVGSENAKPERRVRMGVVARGVATGLASVIIVQARRLAM